MMEGGGGVILIRGESSDKGREDCSCFIVGNGSAGGKGAGGFGDAKVEGINCGATVCVEDADLIA